MNDVQVFQNEQFGRVRTIVEGDKVLFCASDVAKALGYSNERDAVSRHCKGVVKRDTITDTRGSQEMRYIPEGDVYRLIVRSKLPAAEKFESWVMDEVLPTIRKHGAYMTDITLDKMLSDPREMAKLLTALADEREQRIALEQQNAEKQKLIEEYKPKVVKYDTILDSKALISPTTIAKSCGFTSAMKLNEFLYEHGIQYKHGSIWELYSKYSGKGYMSSYHFTDHTGRVRVSNAWTPKGYIFLCDNVFKPNGIEPASVEATLSLQSEHPIAS